MNEEQSPPPGQRGQAWSCDQSQVSSLWETARCSQPPRFCAVPKALTYILSLPLQVLGHSLCQTAFESLLG